MPKYLSSDHDPLYRFGQWQANLRILEVAEIKTVPYVPLSHTFVERLIGTIRREYLDQTLFWTTAYLEEKLQFPFLTRCVQERAISPLRVGDEVEVVGMAPEGECLREMFVETPWEHKRTLAVPLSQLKVVHGDEETTQAVEDWHYWVGMGYQF